MEKIEKSDLEAIVATNTIPLQEKMIKCPKIKVLEVIKVVKDHKD